MILRFEPREEVPPEMLAEIDALVWPVAGHDAVPIVMRCGVGLVPEVGVRIDPTVVGSPDPAGVPRFADPGRGGSLRRWRDVTRPEGAPRMKRFALLLAPALLVSALAAGTAAARPGLDPAKQAQRAERIQAELGLDDATTTKLKTLFTAQQAKREQAHAVLKTERDALRSLVDGRAPDAAVKAQIAKVRAARDAMPERGAFVDDAAKILTPTQQAKLMLMKGEHGKRGKHMRGGEAPAPAR